MGESSDIVGLGVAVEVDMVNKSVFNNYYTYSVETVLLVTDVEVKINVDVNVITSLNIHLILVKKISNDHDNLACERAIFKTFPSSRKIPPIVICGIGCNVIRWSLCELKREMLYFL